jgi:hypothetical protein
VGADRRQMSCRRSCRPPYRAGPRAGTTGRCGGKGTARLSNWARHEHDGRRAGPCSGHAFSCRAWADPSCPCHLAMYTPPLLSTTRSQTQLGTHLRRGGHGGAVDVASRRSGEGATGRNGGHGGAQEPANLDSRGGGGGSPGDVLTAEATTRTPPHHRPSGTALSSFSLPPRTAADTDLGGGVAHRRGGGAAGGERWSRQAHSSRERAARDTSGRGNRHAAGL